MRRIRAPFNRTALFEECVSDVADRYGRQFRLLLLRSKENKIDEGFRLCWLKNIYRLRQPWSAPVASTVDRDHGTRKADGSFNLLHSPNALCFPQVTGLRRA